MKELFTNLGLLASYLVLWALVSVARVSPFKVRRAICIFVGRVMGDENMLAIWRQIDALRDTRSVLRDIR